MRTHTRTHTRKHAHTHTHTHTYIKGVPFLSASITLPGVTHTYKNTYIYKHTHSHEHSHIHPHIHRGSPCLKYLLHFAWYNTRTHTYVNMHVHIHTHRDLAGNLWLSKNVEFNFGLGAVAVATSPGIVPEMETTNHPNGECDLLEPKTTASVHGATIHYTDNAERSCGSPTT